MIDEFDYKEPTCPLCDGEKFYYPKKDAPLGTVPVDRIISKVDSLFDKNEYEEAGRLLLYWRDEAVKLRDRRGELAIENELVGYYRKVGNREEGLTSVSRCLALVEELGQAELASGATVFLNCATAYNAFSMPEKAMELYYRTETIYKSTLPEDDSRFGGLYNNMALAFVSLERFDEAERAYHSALAVMQGVDGGEAESAITYINMAHLYEVSGKRERICLCLASARELLDSENLPHNGYYAFVLEKCAPSFGYFGDTDTYEKMMKEVERIYAGA